jgi:hypothetical protein
MPDDKRRTGGPDRRRIASKQPYEVEDFHQKHKHLTHMYGPAVRRKRFWRSGGCAVLHQCIRPLI